MICYQVGPVESCSLELEQHQHDLFFSFIWAINVCLLCSNRLEKPAAKVVCMDLTLFIDKLDEIAVIYYFPRFIASLGPH